MALMAGLILMNYEAAAQKDARPSRSGFTCNIDGIPAKDRAHYEQLVESLRHAILEMRELPNGYAFRIDGCRSLATAEAAAPHFQRWPAPC